MGKKRCRKAYVSKGSRRNVANGVGLVRKDGKEGRRSFNELAAWRAGKNPWITVVNSVKQQTNMKFIRVRANDLYGNPKYAVANLFRGE